jgi:hypothetical protein
LPLKKYLCLRRHITCDRRNNSGLFNEFVCKLGFFGMGGPRMLKKLNLHTNELNTTFFLFDELLKGSKSLKIFKISLTFRFIKLYHLLKSVHTGENSQILTVSNKKLNNCENFEICHRCLLKVLVERIKGLGELIGSNPQHFGKYLQFCYCLLISY